MSISFNTENIELPEINKSRVSNWIKDIASKYNKRVGELSYLFCDDNKILEVNRQYLQHDFYTDIITFDYSERNKISGDIFISLDTVRSNAQLFDTNFIDELHRVIIHGVLHLCGIDDITDEQERKMRKAEEEALALLILFK